MANLGKRDCNRDGWADCLVGDQRDVAARSPSAQAGARLVRHSLYSTADQRPAESAPSYVAPPLLAEADIGNNPAPALAEAPAPPPAATLSIPPSTPAPTLPLPPPKKKLLPYVVPVAAVLLYENFSRYRDGDAADWGPNTFIKTGLDRRNWLVSNADGAHPVGYRMPLPNEFSFECRYSAYLPELTRGVLGWWKEPVATKISFLNDQGVKYSIDWTIRYGYDPTKLNPLGSSSLYPKKYYHTVKLPDGTTNEVAVIPPSGILRIDRDKTGVKLFIDGQPAVAGPMSHLGQLAGFEINVVKATTGTLFFTDFKVTR